MLKINQIMLITLLSCGVISCNNYKPALSQGNKLSSEQLVSLKTNMSKEQVLDLLGTPTLDPDMDQSRWVYAHCYVPGAERGIKADYQNLTLFFKDNKLQNYTGDFKLTHVAKK